MTALQRLARRPADTPEGNRIVSDAIRLARMPEYANLTEGELLRLAYWGCSGGEGEITDEDCPEAIAQWASFGERDEGNWFTRLHDSDKAWAERNGGQRERE